MLIKKRFFIGFSFTVFMISSVIAEDFKYADYKPTININYQPDISTDEGGFWYKVNQLEKNVKSSPYLIRDEELNQYISKLVCKLAGEYCSSIRVYIIDNPNFNASMYPNGMMQIWTGLLLRIENEDQLAAILGHEIAHYLRTHQIEQWRNAHNNAAISLILDAGIAAVTGVYGIASLAMLGNNSSFSREHEKEADIIGVNLMSEAGYDPMEASHLWYKIIEERKNDESIDNGFIFFASHPPSEKRTEYLRQYAETITFEKHVTVNKKLQNIISKQYYNLMRNHIALGEYGQSQTLLERHNKLRYPKKYINFFYGELYRKRAKEGDIEKAIEYYTLASKLPEPPVDVFKQLGYIYLKKNKKNKSLKNFSMYLKLNPNANDKAMINYYIKSLG